MSDVSEGLSKTCCVIVPACNEEGRIGGLVAEILRHNRNVVVIDDGSADGTSGEARQAGAVVVRHESNKGKGIALHTGFRYAREHGFGLVITMDGDGQHDPAEIPRFLEAHGRTGAPVVIGNRMNDTAQMPFVRWFTNWYMSRLLSGKMGQRVPDTQCGYRLYRCDVLPSEPPDSDRYAAESEILLELAESGARMESVPIATIYNDSVSKINRVKDTARFFRMLRRFRRKRREEK